MKFSLAGSAPGRRASPRSALLVFAFALFARLLVVGWAASRLPPTADGHFYHVVAGRIADGLGYTWAWPDGAVTFAAHYPVGYPGLLGLTYFLFGSSVVAAMVMNALLGAAGCAAMVAVSREAVAASPFRAFQERAALAAGLSAALLPSLVFYAPALMTEGAVASVVALALRVAVALRGRTDQRNTLRVLLWLGLGVLAGGATLLRPQSILFAPVLGWVAATGGNGPGGRGLRREMTRGLKGGLATALVALSVCAPWTYRNCEKMEHCVFVSANGGWNLLIGTYSEGNGAWVPIDETRVPAACTNVFQEAAKDRCFRAAAGRRIRSGMAEWLALAPQKLRQTFDFTAAASGHWAEAGALPERALWGASIVEVVTQRLLHVLGALGCLTWVLCRRRRRAARVAGWCALGAVLLGFGGMSATLGWVGLVGLAALAGALWVSAGVALLCSAVVFTALVHAVFFGAGRYALPLSLWAAPLTALGVGALNLLTVRQREGDNSQHGPH